MNENAMLPHNFQLMLSGLKTKDGIKDGCQDKVFKDFNCFTIYLYGIHI